jgi:glutamyl-tRNA synthetase
MENMNNTNEATSLWQKALRLAFPDCSTTPDELENKYPKRSKNGQTVTRIAPSPTGFLHIGSLYAALISERYAHQNDGTFYLRVEDTDHKREVEGATERLIDSLAKFGIFADEGPKNDGTETGKYGPYRQSERKAIYDVFIKELLSQKKAYFCFCSEEELAEKRSRQEQLGERTGYYGKYASCRDLPEEDVLARLENGDKYIIRLRSEGDFGKQIHFDDQIKGRMSQPENDIDIVIMKSDGLPTYHLAHVVDDHLMRTTNAIRGLEWLPSTNIHLQLFAMFGWQPPVYGHLSPIGKKEGESRRKLSKRKDPEANVEFYEEIGLPINAVIEYLLNLASPFFEEWRKANPKVDNKEFSIKIEKLSSTGGALFDMVKLNDVSREVISFLAPEEIFELGTAWAKKYSPKLYAEMIDAKDYCLQILNIERNDDKPRKDIAKWSDLPFEIGYFFDQIYIDIEKTPLEDTSEAIKLVTEGVSKIYDENDDKELWLNKLREFATSIDYANNMKEYKANPDAYKGNFGDIARIIRVIMTGRTNSPDLYEVMKVLGQDRVVNRLRNYSK